MATSKDFIEFVSDQVRDAGDISYKKMFGEYMVYAGRIPVLLVCDDTVFVKKLPAVEDIFKKHNSIPDVGFPYPGAKEHYILDIENLDLVIEMVTILGQTLPRPKPRKPKAKK